MSISRRVAKTLNTSPYIVLLVIWALVTAINVNKAFHIDDVFHLEAAEWIRLNPLRPMSGTINWYNISEPIFHFNQPPGYFYFVAMVGAVFGFSEVPLHLAQAVISLLAIVYFYKLLCLFQKDFALTGTCFLALGPAFLVNQNLMIDIPILCLSIIFIYLLVQADEARNIYLASIILTFGLLLKYSLLPLLLVLLYAVLEKRKPHLIKALLIPAVALLAWAGLNYMEFGSSHMLGRPRNEVTLSLISNNFIAFILTTGGVAPFSLMFISAFQKVEKKRIVIAVAIGIAIFVVAAYVLVYGPVVRSIPYSLFWTIFAYNGLLVIILFFFAARRMVPDRKAVIVFLWGLAMGAFILIYSPFMATRHVLLLLPPFIILGGYVYRNTLPKATKASIGLTCFLGLALGISDWVYADFYRKAVPMALKHVPTNSKVWTTGHWGWQWYSKKAGMLFYEYDVSDPQAGDYFVIPEVIAKQKVSDNIVLEKEESISYSPTLLNFFTTAHFARFYNSYSYQLPWYLSVAPVDSVGVYRVSGVE
ncbi:Dolichyl-phosphate-mannose-protein mannosyltransferase [Pontibacter chinhatensis]|uniref:Dolichyl-phosphate-mannose-protein mannosyltransferase n=1 Tax=Pontibacter chinhatensis TaxID=1436961 RepID=A0A1I2REA4_9BACT|nr:Dolichyl-phosphate-mannose-protein mannosyltransferase [Pontibacter chinhatensis]